MWASEQVELVGMGRALIGPLRIGLQRQVLIDSTPPSPIFSSKMASCLGVYVHDSHEAESLSRS